MGFEAERAKRRQAEHARQNQPQAKKTNGATSQKGSPVTPSEKGKTQKKVAEKLGIGQLTAERSAFCVRVMDALDKIGKTVEVH
jgi:hypothetical protein